MNKEYLRRTINRVFDDGGTTLSRKMLRLTSEGDWRAVKDALAEWRDRVFLKIECEPENAEDDTICVKITHRINP